MAGQLAGRTALVTGASSGIGRAVALALAEAGARVAIAARRRDRLTDLAARIGALPLDLDVTDEAACRRAVERTVDELGGLDILVNNAGLMLLGQVEGADTGDWRRMVETNVLGLMRMTRLCVPALVESELGHIVNIGSVAGIWSYVNGSSYVASKFAVHGYTRALRDDLQGKPVRITNVAGGLVETNFSKVRFHGDEEKANAVYSNVAMGGPLQATDISDCIMFALTRPPHVNIDEIVVMALAQVSGGNILRTS